MQSSVGIIAVTSEESPIRDISNKNLRLTKLEEERQQVKGRQLVGTAMDGRNGTVRFDPEEVQGLCVTRHETG